ncbi:MAG TPA: DUF2254 domain-containing protein [Allosphingosinicella sp.]|nr:DUF2254 domain-containing protein [Allosphingosinicella sp.]
MNSRIVRLVDQLRASYWFLPSVMAIFAILLGVLTVWLDAAPAAGLLDGLGWYQAAKPDGAREVLSTIAGSMITVAGVVFSITIVAIAYAASQYGPRILTNFMSDQGNQVTLGTFIATFAYCLVVLRTIRSGDEGAFVPQISVMVGLLLALCSIGVLIYFIHHVPHSIHINTVVARIGEQLIDSVDQRFPADIGDPEDTGGAATAHSAVAESSLAQGTGVTRICARANGYVEAVDDEALMETARRKDMVLRLHHVPGDFIVKGQLLVSAWPAGRLDESGYRALRDCYSISDRRSPFQDLFFLVDELVEIGARALSSGVNDPYTAITCLDWLGAAAVEMCGRRMPSGRRVDDEGVLRAISDPHTFAQFIDRGFGRFRPYLARDLNAAVHAIETLAMVAEQCSAPECVKAVDDEVGKLLSLAEHELKEPSLAQLRTHHHALLQTRQHSG